MNALTTLEEILTGDRDKRQLMPILEQLTQTISEMEEALRTPLTPEQYASIERKRLSCLAAIRVVIAAWHIWMGETSV